MDESRADRGPRARANHVAPPAQVAGGRAASPGAEKRRRKRMEKGRQIPLHARSDVQIEMSRRSSARRRRNELAHLLRSACATTDRQIQLTRHGQLPRGPRRYDLRHADIQFSDRPEQSLDWPWYAILRTAAPEEENGRTRVPTD